MNLPEQTAMELDLHCLEPRYAATRVAAPQVLNTLIRSIGETDPLGAARGDCDDTGGKRTSHSRALSARGVDTAVQRVAEGLTQSGAASAACAADSVDAVAEEPRLATR